MDEHQGEVLLNRNAGVDVLHEDPGEECNTDDAEDRKYVDEDTAEALVSTRQATWCQHCSRRHDDPQLLNTRGSAP